MSKDAEHRRWRKSTLSVLLAVQLLCISCATLHVPESAPQFKPQEFVRVAKSGLSLEARPITQRESYWDLFEDYLPELGLAAIWINIQNERADSVDLDARHWRLLSAGHECRLLSTDALFERYYKTRQIRAFSVSSDQQAREKLQPLLLDLTTPLRPAETRSGFAFFRVRPSKSTEWLNRARLMLRDVRLPGKASLTLELPLTYATS